jgi:AraC-like DNA-binding protein
MQIMLGPRPAAAPVSTLLTPTERLRVDAAGQGLWRTLHRDTLDDAIRDVREQRASAVLVSVTRCGDDAAFGGAPVAARVAAMVREFPRVPAVALLTEVRAATPRTVLSLGRSGVHALVDVREPAGWRDLRAALAPGDGGDVERLALTALAADLAGTPPDCRQFFDALFKAPPRTSTVRELARTLGVLPSTLMSRFFRARLPAPKRYLAYARLVRAARLLESRGYSVANVADRLDYSSPQSFGRHVRALTGLTAGEFRRTFDALGMLERFRSELVLPHLATLRDFRPLTAPPGWTPRAGR